MKAKTIKVELGGDKRTLRFDLNAVVLYEEATGKSALDGLLPESVRDFRALIWACLATASEAAEEEPASLTQVGTWLGEEDALDRLYRDMVELIRQNAPEARPAGEGADGPPDPPMAAAGSSAPTPSESSSSD